MELTTWGRAAGARVALIAPGRAEAAAKYAEVAHELLLRGFDRVVAVDWRGQGRTPRQIAEAPAGHIAAFDVFLNDLAPVADRLRAEADTLLMLGHSMGAHLLLRHLLSQPAVADRAIFVSPMIRIRGPAPWITGAAAGLMIAVGRGRRRAVRTKRRAFDDNVLTHDQARFERYGELLAAEPELATGPPTWRWVREAVRSCKTLRREAKTAGDLPPLLFVLAGEDRVVDSSASAALAAHLPSAQVVTIPGAYHEVMMEQDAMRASFWAAVDAFLAG